MTKGGEVRGGEEDDFFLNIMYCWEALNVMVSFLGVTGNAA